MRSSILAVLFAWAILPIGALVSGADDTKKLDKKPVAVFLVVTDYRGLTGPFTQFYLKEDGTWTNTIKKGGKNVEMTSGKLKADESKALLAYIQGLELEKHTRNRKVEDAAMFSVYVGQVEFLDIAPEPASKVMNKVKEVREAKEKK